MQPKDIERKGEPQRSTDEKLAEDGRDTLREYFDGMGTATARIIINRDIDDNQSSLFCGLPVMALRHLQTTLADDCRLDWR